MNPPFGAGNGGRNNASSDLGYVSGSRENTVQPCCTRALNLFIQQEIVARYAALSYSTCNGGGLDHNG